MSWSPHESQIERNWDRLIEEFKQAVHELREIKQQAEKLTKQVTRLANEFAKKFPIRGIFTQGEPPMPVTGTITGLLPGASDTFFVTPVDVNGNADQLPAGSPVPTITSDDSSVILNVAADGMSATVATAPGATPGSSFNLLWSASYTGADGNPVSITATASVPVLTPPALLPVGGVISQGSPATAAAAKR